MLDLPRLPMHIFFSILFLAIFYTYGIPKLALTKVHYIQHIDIEIDTNNSHTEWSNLIEVFYFSLFYQLYKIILIEHYNNIFIFL